jgi:hypothetical protein
MKDIDGAMRGLVNVLLALEPLSKDERKRVLFAAISALDELDNGTSSGATGPSPNAPRHIDFVEDVDHDFVYDVNAIGEYFREPVTIKDRNPKYPFIDDMD